MLSKYSCANDEDGDVCPITKQSFMKDIREESRSLLIRDTKKLGGHAKTAAGHGEICVRSAIVVTDLHPLKCREAGRDLDLIDGV